MWETVNTEWYLDKIDKLDTIEDLVYYIHINTELHFSDFSQEGFISAISILNNDQQEKLTKKINHFFSQSNISQSKNIFNSYASQILK